MWYVYILECADGTLYTGITTDVTKRILTHNKGKGAKYTKARLPVVLKASFEAEDRSKASKEEYRIKQLSRQEKIKLINESSANSTTQSGSN
jgi:putative endonuclease